MALAIFSVIGFGSWQLLNQVLQSHETVQQRDTALAEMQRGMWVLARDLRNLAIRPIRNEYFQVEPAISTLESSYALTFTRNGWDNPTHQARGTLQRVAYRVGNIKESSYNKQTHLLRSYWPALDRSRDTEHYEQVLIPNVSDIEFRFIDRAGIPRSHWPTSSSALDTSENDLTPDQLARSQFPLPLAITVRISSEVFGDITRTFAMGELVDE
ncbi:type II secretion system minor pseudopilin GspJ [bacterium SCSIO 12696]|nr:type II secretion system minor pseudopilin GspJ [bacterium SCSIO 12696]